MVGRRLTEHLARFEHCDVPRLGVVERSLRVGVAVVGLAGILRAVHGHVGLLGPDRGGGRAHREHGDGVLPNVLRIEHDVARGLAEGQVVDTDRAGEIENNAPAVADAHVPNEGKEPRDRGDRSPHDRERVSVALRVELWWRQRWWWWWW